MQTIALAAFDQVLSSSLLGTIDCFQVANTVERLNFGASKPRFDWKIVSPEGKAVQASNGQWIGVDGDLQSLPVTVPLLVPALHYEGDEDFFLRLKQNQALATVLRDRVAAGGLVGGICTGTFFVADSGLLDGKVSTTSWWMEAQFRRRYPQIELQVDRVMVEADGVLTAGANTANYSLALYLLEQMAGPALARAVAKVMLLDLGKLSQRPYALLPPAHLVSKDADVEKAQRWMEAHLGQSWGVEDIAKAVGLGGKTLSRKFKDSLGASPAAYANKLRIEAAKRLLEMTEETVDQISLAVGYEDVRSFRRSFKAATGLAPRSFRLRFRAPRSLVLT